MTQLNLVQRNINLAKMYITVIKRSFQITGAFSQLVFQTYTVSQHKLLSYLSQMNTADIFKKGPC